MKKPRASRWITGRSSNTPGRDVSIRCIYSNARLFAHLQQSPKVTITVGQINPKLMMQIEQSREESSHDFRSTFRNSTGTPDCERQQATVRCSHTSQWFGGGHLPMRWRGSNLVRFLSSCSSVRNDGRDRGGPAHRTLSFRVSQSD